MTSRRVMTPLLVTPPRAPLTRADAPRLPRDPAPAALETETRSHWHYTHAAWGGVITEAEALRLLPDAERIEGTDTVAIAPPTTGGTTRTPSLLQV